MKTQAWLDQLDQINRDGDRPAKRALVPKLLTAASGAVVARGLRLLPVVAEDAEQLEQCFLRLRKSGRKLDAGCRGKEAILRLALDKDWPLQELWRSALHTVQEEPVFGGRVDTAATLRGLGGLGMLRSGGPDAALELAELLADREVEARKGAIEALRESRADWAAALLLHRLVAGGEETDLQAELLLALLELRPEAGLRRAGSMLESRESIKREAACFALAEDPGAESAELLWNGLANQLLPADRRPFWLALALMRCEEGRGRLLEEIKGMPPPRREELQVALEGIQDEDIERTLQGD